METSDIISQMTPEEIVNHLVGREGVDAVALIFAQHGQGKSIAQGDTMALMHGTLALLKGLNADLNRESETPAFTPDREEGTLAEQGA